MVSCSRTHPSARPRRSLSEEEGVQPSGTLLSVMYVILIETKRCSGRCQRDSKQQSRDQYLAIPAGYREAGGLVSKHSALRRWSLRW